MAKTDEEIKQELVSLFERKMSGLLVTYVTAKAIDDAAEEVANLAFELIREADNDNQ